MVRRTNAQIRLDKEYETASVRSDVDRRYWLPAAINAEARFWIVIEPHLHTLFIKKYPFRSRPSEVIMSGPYFTQAEAEKAKLTCR